MTTAFVRWALPAMALATLVGGCGLTTDSSHSPAEVSVVNGVDGTQPASAGVNPPLTTTTLPIGTDDPTTLPIDAALPPVLDGTGGELPLVGVGPLLTSDPNIVIDQVGIVATADLTRVLFRVTSTSETDPVYPGSVFDLFATGYTSSVGGVTVTDRAESSVLSPITFGNRCACSYPESLQPGQSAVYYADFSPVSNPSGQIDVAIPSLTPITFTNKQLSS